MVASKLSPTQVTVIKKLARGWTLKSHRFLDGRKLYKLYSLDGSAETIRSSTVAVLKRKGLIYSNHKFPAAAYTLTNEGKTLAAAWGESVVGLSTIVQFGQ